MILLSFGSSFWSRLELISCVFLSYLTTDMAEYWHWHACAVKGSTFVCFHSVGRKKSYCQGFIPVARSTNNEYRLFFFPRLTSVYEANKAECDGIWRFVEERKKANFEKFKPNKANYISYCQPSLFFGGKESLQGVILWSSLCNHMRFTFKKSHLTCKIALLPRAE